MLSANDFSAFFKEVHDHEPFPWQRRLLEQIAQNGIWPGVLDLPTGAGKTAAIDIAVFHLALEAELREARRAPIRIAFVVDRRLIVDDAFARAQRIADALVAQRGTVTQLVAERLVKLSGDGPPLIARRLRGGVPREDDWARTPSQPTVLCSTVDQIGSRLLFRGYGVSDSMKPVHAGLIGSDCLILLDEAHLAEPFRQTLGWVRTYSGEGWSEVRNNAPGGVAILTATPHEELRGGFSLSEKDRSHPVLKKRLEASKPAQLIASAHRNPIEVNRTDLGHEGENTPNVDLLSRAITLVDQVDVALKHFEAVANGARAPAIGVVVNRVMRARAVFERLASAANVNQVDRLLLIGPARPVDRDDIAGRLAPIRTGATRNLHGPLIVVATQCLEAGVDIDLDALITEVAPLDALRQRFGRLNRAGRDVVPYAAIVATKSDISGQRDDPVYGKAIKAAWECLTKATEKGGPEDLVDFGLHAFKIRLQDEALSPKLDAPILLPAHLDLLSQTSPIPSSDPDVALYLHGPSRQPDSIAVIWRADIEPERQPSKDLRRLLLLVQPRPQEAIELPLWAVRQWLREGVASSDRLADAATAPPEEEAWGRRDRNTRSVFRWKGDDERSRWITAYEIHAGDTVIVPTSYGGIDEFGWNPERRESATDVWQKAARPFAGRRFVVRVAPGLLPESLGAEMLADALAGAASQHWQDLRTAVLELNLPEFVRDDLAALDEANAGKVAAYTDLYGIDGEGRPRGIVFVAPFGIARRERTEEGRPNATEDDISGSIPGFRLTLAQHSQDVETKAETFARAAGLSEERVTDLKLAGFMHDFGKADPRFQAWLHYADPLGQDGEAQGAVLAKSDRPLPPVARIASSLPENWRHEAFSVRLAPLVARFRDARDADLVLWLVGSHHGHGRPLFPHQDPEETKSRQLPAALGLPTEVPPGSGPQSLAFDWNGLDWTALFARLKARYGVWELARMEAILRLADHRASEESAAQEERE